MKHIIHGGKVGANDFPLRVNGRWLEREKKSTFSRLVSVGHVASKENVLAFFVYYGEKMFNVVIDIIRTI